MCGMYKWYVRMVCTDGMYKWNVRMEYINGINRFDVRQRETMWKEQKCLNWK